MPSIFNEITDIHYELLKENDKIKNKNHYNIDELRKYRENVGKIKILEYLIEQCSNGYYDEFE